MRLLVLFVLVLAGCPELATTTPISDKCMKQYEKCKLPTGPLGVCDTVDCPSGESGPCFKCNPQH